MKSKYRALIWEQARLAGVISVWIMSVCLLTGFVIWLTTNNAIVESKDASVITSASIFIAMMACALLMGLRFDHLGNLATGFDPRLFRLPVSTGALVGITVTCRIAFLSVVSMVLICLSNIFYSYTGEIISLRHLFWIIEIYLILQAMTWCRKSIPVVSIIIYILVLLFIPSLLLVISFQGKIDGINAFQFIGTRIPFFLFATVISITLTFLGARCERRNKRYGPPSLSEINEWFRDARRTRTKPFKSALEAQIWYERQKRAWALPVFTCGCFLLLLITFAIIKSSPQKISSTTWDVLWLIPPFAILMGAIITGGAAGVINFGPKTAKPSYPFLRPISTSLLARARLSMLFNSLCVTFLGVIVITGIFFILTNWIIVELIQNMLASNELTLLERTGAFCRPLLAIFVVAWMLIWGITRGYLLLPLCIISTLILNEATINHNNILPILLLEVILFSFIRTGMGLWKCRKKSYLSKGGAVTIIIAWLVASGAFLLGGTKFDAFSCILCFAVMTWPFYPFMSTPLNFHRRRHQ